MRKKFNKIESVAVITATIIMVGAIILFVNIPSTLLWLVEAANAFALAVGWMFTAIVVLGYLGFPVFMGLMTRPNNDISCLATMLWFCAFQLISLMFNQLILLLLVASFPRMSQIAALIIKTPLEENLILNPLTLIWAIVMYTAGWLFSVLQKEKKQH